MSMDDDIDELLVRRVLELGTDLLTKCSEMAEIVNSMDKNWFDDPANSNLAFHLEELMGIVSVIADISDGYGENVSMIN